ncbi:MAG: 30S ribosomal protein S3 [Patescibacteria group bacterium]
MTHKVHPYSHRLGLIRDWRSRWFGVRDKYRSFLRADVLIRQFLKKRLRGFYINAIEIERGQNSWRIIVKTSRPGMVIGRSGEGSIKLKQEIVKLAQRQNLVLPGELHLDIEEVRQPEAHAAIVAYMIAEGLEKRLHFRRIMKQMADKVMANKEVQGVRIDISGRLGGAEIGRRETLKIGRLPLQTLRADVDFAREEAYLSYGVIGIKVWIYKGEVFDRAQN